MKPQKPKSLFPASGPAQNPFLRVYIDNLFHRSYRIDPGQYVIGRDKRNPIVVEDRFISREHCLIEFNGEGQFFVQDLQSANGTFVNNERIIRTAITHGDEIRIGKIRIVVSYRSATKSNVIPFPSVKTEPQIDVTEIEQRSIEPHVQDEVGLGRDEELSFSFSDQFDQIIADQSLPPSEPPIEISDVPYEQSDAFFNEGLPSEIEREIGEPLPPPAKDIEDLPIEISEPSEEARIVPVPETPPKPEIRRRLGRPKARAARQAEFVRAPVRPIPIQTLTWAAVLIAASAGIGWGLHEMQGRGTFALVRTFSSNVWEKSRFWTQTALEWPKQQIDRFFPENETQIAANFENSKGESSVEGPDPSSLQERSAIRLPPPKKERVPEVKQKPTQRKERRVDPSSQKTTQKESGAGLVASLDRSLGKIGSGDLEAADNLKSRKGGDVEKRVKSAKVLNTAGTQPFDVEIQMPNVKEQLAKRDAAAQGRSGKVFQPEEYQKMLRDRLTAVESCYVENAKRGQTSGAIRLWLSIGSNGRVKKSGIDQSTFKNSQLERCILKGVRGLQLDRPPWDEFTVNYTFRFGTRRISF